MPLPFRVTARAAAILLLVLAAGGATTPPTAAAPADRLRPAWPARMLDHPREPPAAPADLDAAATEVGRAEAQVDIDDDDDRDDDEAVYESPRYGYTLAYDADEWEVIEEDADPDDAYDFVSLVNRSERSFVLLVGDPDYGADEMATCVDEYVAGFERGDGISDVEPLDERGAEGKADDRAWATFAYTIEAEDGRDYDQVRYFECLWLGDGVTLVIRHDAVLNDYEAEIAAREALLDGLDLDGFAPAVGAEEAEEGDEDAGEDGGDLAVYESPLYGFTLTYDADEWEIYEEDADPDDAYDSVTLGNRGERSYVNLATNPNYAEDELAVCVADYVDLLAQDEAVSDIEPLDERGAEGENDDRAWATYAYTWEAPDGREHDNVRYFECRWLGEGVTLVVRHNAIPDDYEEESEAREALLDGFAPAPGASDEGEGPDDEGETAGADDAVFAVYQSPHYGYLVTYDADEWSVSTADPVPDDAYDHVTFANSGARSYVSLTGNLDYYSWDMLATCVGDYVGLLVNDATVSGVQPLDEQRADGEAFDRVWATHAYVYTAADGSAHSNVRYVECRLLRDGVTLVVQHNTFIDDYEDEVAAREAFLDGFAPGPDPYRDLTAAQMRDLVEEIYDDLTEVWTEEFDDRGLEYAAPDLVMFGEPTEVPCEIGTAEPGYGPFYCPLNQTLYVDLPFAISESHLYGRGNVFSMVGHEAGHDVQAQLGGPETTYRERELQADCLAGAFLQAAVEAGDLTEADVFAAVDRITILGDPDAAPTDDQSRGTGTERANMVLTGYYSGVDGCGIF